MPNGRRLFQHFWKYDSGNLQLTGMDDPEQAYVYDTQSQSIVRKSEYTLSLTAAGVFWSVPAMNGSRRAMSRNLVISI